MMGNFCDPKIMRFASKNTILISTILDLCIFSDWKGKERKGCSCTYFLWMLTAASGPE